MRKLVLIASLFVSPLAMAQDAEGEPVIKYKERTEIDFDTVDVSGELVKPQGQLLSERRRASFNPLISIRQDFNQEMRSSVNEVK
jgi:hypothetical protein